jgi:hypothetical protein
MEAIHQSARGCDYLASNRESKATVMSCGANVTVLVRHAAVEMLVTEARDGMGDGDHRGAYAPTPASVPDNKPRIPSVCWLGSTGARFEKHPNRGISYKHLN